MTQQYHHSSFTLMEVLVAFSVLAGVLGLTLLGVSSLMDAWHRTDAQARQLERQARTERVLDSLIANAVPFTWPDRNGVESLLFDGDTDSLALVSRHPLVTLDEGTLRFCRLQLVDDHLVIEHRQRPPLPTVAWSVESTRSDLCDGVRAIDIQYVEIAPDGQLAWTPRWDAPTRFPAAIAVTVYWQDGSRLTCLRRTAGAAAHETLANPLDLSTPPET